MKELEKTISICPACYQEGFINKINAKIISSVQNGIVDLSKYEKKLGKKIVNTDFVKRNDAIQKTAFFNSFFGGDNQKTVSDCRLGFRFGHSFCLISASSPQTDSANPKNFKNWFNRTIHGERTA